MKKVVLVSLLALSVMFVNAQVTFGVKGGVNFATLGGDDADELEGKNQTPDFILVVL